MPAESPGVVLMPAAAPGYNVGVKKYRINEIFYSLQGEGVRAGTANLFLRFSGCNETCTIETHGFDCDTEFASGRSLDIPEILQELEAARRCDATPDPLSQNSATASAAGQFRATPAVFPMCQWIVMTGGEPGLQVDRPLLDALHAAGYRLAIETNGSIALPGGVDWITVSPKVAEHAIRQRVAHEVKYVRAYGQAIPRTVVQADHRLISPAFSGDQLDRRTLEWCMQLVRENPDWRLSIQMHKAWRIR